MFPSLAGLPASRSGGARPRDRLLTLYRAKFPSRPATTSTSKCRTPMFPARLRALRTRDLMYPRTADKPWLLFDLAKDPWQMKNLVDDPASQALVRQMDVSWPRSCVRRDSWERQSRQAAILRNGSPAKANRKVSDARRGLARRPWIQPCRQRRRRNGKPSAIECNQWLTPARLSPGPIMRKRSISR